MTEWHTIDSAPISPHPFANKKLKFLLLWNGRHRCVGSVHSEEFAEESGGRYWREDGTPIFPDPTHWSPMIDPPTPNPKEHGE